jgi:hypothetical protein
MKPECRLLILYGIMKELNEIDYYDEVSYSTLLCHLTFFLESLQLEDIDEDFDNFLIFLDGIIYFSLLKTNVLIRKLAFKVICF